MRLAHTIEELQEALRGPRSEGKRIGLVPTMGFLHEGHLSLVDICKRNADFTIVSIFVNPTQFGRNEDLELYPRDESRDLNLCEIRGVDLVFIPSSTEMYPEGYSTFIDEESASLGLCGKSRPGHFRGVLTVCAKLFHLTGCNIAVFGQKDAQQVTLLEKMIRELNMTVGILRGPISRENDGLAMSSRNAYLDVLERRIAPTLHKALMRAEIMVLDEGERDSQRILDQMKAFFDVYPEIRLDYLEVVDRKNLLPIRRVEIGNTLVAGAMFLGKTRLIDNLQL